MTRSSLTALVIVTLLFLGTFMYFSEAATHFQSFISGTPIMSRHTTQIFMTRVMGNPVAGAKTVPVGWASNGTINGVTDEGILPLTGTFLNFHAYVDNAPGAGASWTITLRHGNTNSNITCTISGSATSCSDLSHTYSASVGDLMNIQFAVSGSPVPAALYATVQFSPTIPNQTALIFASSALDTTAEKYGPAVAILLGWLTAENSTSVVIPEAGTFEDLYLHAATSLTSGSYGFYLRDATQNATSSVTCSVTAADCNDTSDTFAPTANDLVDIAALPNAPNTSTNYAGGIVFVPTSAGDFDLLKRWNSNDSASIVNYIYPSASYDTSGPGFEIRTIEASSSEYADAMTIKGLSVSVNTAPGGAASRTFALRDNSVTTAATCTVTGSATTCTWSGSVAIAEGDLIDIADSPSGSPAVTTGAFGMVANATALGPTVINATGVSRPTYVNASFTPPNLQNGLIGWWTFDGPYLLQNVADSSGQNDTAFLTGATSTAIGSIGQALTFSGSNNYATMLTNLSLSAFTISGWIKTSSPAQTATMFGDSGATSGAGNKIGLAGGNFSVVAGGSACTSVAVPTDAMWHFFAATRDASNVWTLYLDTVATNCGSGPGSSTYSLSTFGANGSDHSQDFTGSLDDVRVWNRPLSAGELNQLYFQGK